VVGMVAEVDSADLVVADQEVEDLAGVGKLIVN